MCYQSFLASFSPLFSRIARYAPSKKTKNLLKNHLITFTKSNDLFGLNQSPDYKRTKHTNCRKDMRMLILRHNFQHTKTFLKKIHSRGKHSKHYTSRVLYNYTRHIHAFPNFTPNGAKNFILYPHQSPFLPTSLNPADSLLSKCCGW